MKTKQWYVRYKVLVHHTCYSHSEEIPFFCFFYLLLDVFSTAFWLHNWKDYSKFSYLSFDFQNWISKDPTTPSRSAKTGCMADTELAAKTGACRAAEKLWRERLKPESGNLHFQSKSCALPLKPTCFKEYRFLLWRQIVLTVSLPLSE